MERTRSPGSCGSQALKTKRMSKREQMNGPARVQLKVNHCRLIASNLHTLLPRRKSGSPSSIHRKHPQQQNVFPEGLFL